MYAYYKIRRARSGDRCDGHVHAREPDTPRGWDYALYVKGLVYFDQGKGALERLFRKSVENRPPRDAELSFSAFQSAGRNATRQVLTQPMRKQRMIYLKKQNWRRTKTASPGSIFARVPTSQR